MVKKKRASAEAIRKKTYKPEKVDWRKEFRATHCINNIRETLKTYWDDDYKLFKINKAIEKWINHFDN